MTEKVPLEAMIRRASRMAEEMFAAQGNVDMFWLVETASGEQRTLVTPVIPPPGCDPAQFKRELIDEMREYAWKQEPDISQFVYEIASSPEKQNDNEIVGGLNAELAKRYAAYVLLPPLLTLALGLVGAWVVSSFERMGT